MICIATVFLERLFLLLHVGVLSSKLAYACATQSLNKFNNLLYILLSLLYSFGAPHAHLCRNLCLNCLYKIFYYTPHFGRYIFLLVCLRLPYSIVLLYRVR